MSPRYPTPMPTLDKPARRISRATSLPFNACLYWLARGLTPEQLERAVRADNAAGMVDGTHARKWFAGRLRAQPGWLKYAWGAGLVLTTVDQVLRAKYARGRRWRKAS